MAPPRAVGSVEELFAIAQAMGHDAATCYGALADRARGQGVPEIADLFEQLREEKQDNERSVLEWAQQQSGQTPDPAEVKWKLPQTFDDEAVELAGSRLATPYRVLSMAVRNEERVFVFWSYVAAEADTPQVRLLAEQMAREELAQVALLRRARRRAYHAQRESALQPDVQARMAEAGILELRLADHLDELAARSTGERAHRMRDLAKQARTMAQEIRGVAPHPSEKQPSAAEPLATAERLVESYLDVADTSGDEQTVAAVQSLARRAIERLAWMRALDTERTTVDQVHG